ncbi:MAG: tyrosine-type recombinase/integrase [Synergistaceae bacterium]|nr:tyrosine-type recombinase/integrase [Synergistaceae bacterium]
MRGKAAEVNDAGLRFDRRTIEDFAASLTLSPHSVASYKKCLAYFFAYLARKGIDRPASGDVAAYGEELSSSGRSANTVYGYIAAVKAFFRWAQTEGVYRDIAAEVPLPRPDRAPNRKTLTATQLRKILNGIDRETLQGVRDYAILALMITMGLSALEISQAKMGDIRKSENETVLHVRGGDGQRHDVMRIPPPVAETVSKYLDARFQVDPDAPREERVPLFVSVSPRNRDKNEPMSAGSISRIAKNAIRGAGYDGERLSAQSLKVSAMKLALRRGERLEDVQKFARHRQIRTTFLYEPAENASMRKKDVLQG